jgi:ABC-type uncharacterized transport system permease subunit
MTIRFGTLPGCGVQYSTAILIILTVHSFVVAAADVSTSKLQIHVRYTKKDACYFVSIFAVTQICCLDSSIAFSQKWL